MSENQPEAIGLKRSLRFWDLVLYGIGPDSKAHGFDFCRALASSTRRRAPIAVTAILLAMIAMLFTSVSYGRMARVYPHGGSACSVRRQKRFYTSLGYLTGWCLVMDYIL